MTDRLPIQAPLFPAAVQPGAVETDTNGGGSSVAILNAGADPGKTAPGRFFLNPGGPGAAEDRPWAKRTRHTF